MTRWPVLRCFIVPIIALLAVANCAQASDDIDKGPKAEKRVSLIEIPVAFVGEWSADPKYCGYEGDDLDNRLFVATKRVGYYENGHVVENVEQTGDTIAIRYRPASEMDLIAPEFLKLSGDGARLFTNPKGEGQGYWRCPKSE